MSAGPFFVAESGFLFMLFPFRAFSVLQCRPSFPSPLVWIFCSYSRIAYFLCPTLYKGPKDCCEAGYLDRWGLRPQQRLLCCQRRLVYSFSSEQPSYFSSDHAEQSIAIFAWLERKPMLAFWNSALLDSPRVLTFAVIHWYHNVVVILSCFFRTKNLVPCFFGDSFLSSHFGFELRSRKIGNLQVSASILYLTRDWFSKVFPPASLDIITFLFEWSGGIHPNPYPFLFWNATHRRMSIAEVNFRDQTV